MGLFSKKDEVPELPPAPALPELPAPQGRKELPELPTFPQSSRNEGLNQEIVKSAVSDNGENPLQMESPPESMLPQVPQGIPAPQAPVAPQPPVAPSVESMPSSTGLPDLPGSNPTPSIADVSSTPTFPNPNKGSMIPSISEPAQTVSVDDEEPIEDPKPSVQKTSTAEPIFVRIDKFQASQKSFDKIRDKVKEIESTLMKIKSVKAKEEEEIAKWGEEMEKLKSRLSDIDENIFSQV